MKKAVIAAMAAAITVGTMAGSVATFSASQDEAQLQIVDDGEASETLPDEQSSPDEEMPQSEDAASANQEEAVSDQNQEAATEQSITEVAASLPSGNIQKTASVEEGGVVSVADIAENVMPAMVSITNTSVQEVQDWFRGGNMQYESKSAGTGVIMGENEDELLIVTNNHVVEDAFDLTVTFINETSVEATVKGTDSDDDLAVVAVKLDDIDQDTLDAIRVASVADSNETRVGEQVVAIGNALGYGQSVTTGIISALGRTVSVRDTFGISDYDQLIQTDAAINAGNSGGALLNMKGEVIGINSIKASASGVEGMGYAIPTEKAIPIIHNLMNKESREMVAEENSAYIGITGSDVTQDVAELYNLPVGVYLTEVGEDTPASQAGLQAGMVMTSFDGNEIKSMSDLQSLLPYYAAGETVTVNVTVIDENGGYEEQEMSLTLGKKTDY